MLQKKPIKVEDIPQSQIMSQRRKLRENMLRQLGEKAAVTEERTDKVLLKT
ncbi:hypothetical protein ACFQ88_22420 [Paenibacillus sp. NPDC056579]|uniref:hypothetical protein n=1 Tax=Paenibacillus sp. NPDC056579 TaxID=3345871 RepID=UPI0036B89EF3